MDIDEAVKCASGCKNNKKIFYEFLFICIESENRLRNYINIYYNYG